MYGAEFYAAGHATYYDADAEMDTLSYAIGMQIGMDNHLRQGYLNLDLDVVLDAVEEGVAQKTFDVESIRENMKNNQMMKQGLGERNLFINGMKRISMVDMVQNLYILFNII